MTIESIEQDLKIGQVAPPTLALMKDWLAAESSSLMDRQLELQLAYSEWFFSKRNTGEYKSDKACDIAWQLTPEGRERLTLENYQRKIKALREAISSHIRVAHDMAQNNY